MLYKQDPCCQGQHGRKHAYKKTKTARGRNENLCFNAAHQIILFNALVSYLQTQFSFHFYNLKKYRCNKASLSVQLLPIQLDL